MAIQAAGAVPAISDYLGPAISDEPQGKTREVFTDSNETPMLNDALFIKGAILPAPQFQTLISPVDRVALYREMVSEHVERRVSIFFQQLVLTYKRGYHFKIGETTQQGGKATTLLVKSEDGREERVKRQAAHSSTLPALYAYPEAQWQEHVAHGAPVEGVVYYKGSTVDRYSNATLEMPIEINQADIAIDGKIGESKLREKALLLIQRSSLGELDPIQGIQQFVVLLVEEIKKQKANVHMRPAIVAALDQYQHQTEEIQKWFQENPRAFDRLLDLRCNSPFDRVQMKERVYQLRFEAIQKEQSAESALLVKINRVQKDVFRAMGEIRKPPLFALAFRVKLIDLVDNFRDQKAVKTVLSFSSMIVVEAVPDGPRILSVKDLPDSRKKFLEKSFHFIAPHEALIVNLVTTLKESLAALRKEELSNRGAIVRVLRKQKGWAQKKLASEITKLFPGQVISQPALSQMENGARPIDAVTAGRLSRALEVPSDLLIPSFFWD